MNPVVTYGGITVGLLVTVRTFIEWWPGRKAFLGSKSDKLNMFLPLAPFLWGYCYGVLVPLTLGGLLAWAGWAGVWLLNWLGDVALWAGVGTELGTASARAQAVRLTPQANAIMLLLTGVVLAVHKKYGNPFLVRGVIAGMTLGLSSGIAGTAAVPLASWLDKAAGLIYGAFA